MSGQKILGERLAAFQLRGRRRRAEYVQPLLAKTIDQTGDQGHFRANHGQRDALADRQPNQPIDVIDGKFDIAASGLVRRAGIARRHQHLGDARGGSEFPGQGVFAPSGADDEHVHGV